MRWPGGVVLVAVRGSAEAWWAFMAAHAIVSRRDLGDGRTAENRTYRDVGRRISCSWQPPASSARSSGPLLGGAAVDAAARRPVRPDLDEPGWLLWLVAPAVDGRTATFRGGRKLDAGLEVQTGGTVPVFATRADNWTINADAPSSEPLPTWLFDELGGRWKRA